MQQKFKINRFIHLLINTVLFLMTKIFRIKGNISKELKNIKEPYLLLSNHVGTYDPFIVAYFIKKPAHFVSSDAVMRDPLIGFLFKRLGVIPKKKNVRDTQVIRDMLTVIKAGGAIGLFPSGTRTWTGTSMPLDPSAAKLVKLLKIPVITVKMKGMQLTNPRWGLKLRRSSIEIDYQLAFSKEEIANASVDEIFTKIKAGVAHDEVDYQRKKRNIIHSKYRAEYIEHVLFLCSACNSIGKIKSDGNDFECSQCQHKTHVNTYGFFEAQNNKILPFDNIRDGYNWQRKKFETYIQKHFKIKTFAPLFSDDSILIYRELNNKMTLLGTASLHFYINRILIKFEAGKQIELPIKDIQILNPQFHEKIEVTYKNDNYRFVGKTPGVSGLKWEIATSTIWRLTGQRDKQSTYLLD